MISGWLGEMFEDDMCTRKFLLVSRGAILSVAHAQTWERGPPLAPMESFQVKYLLGNILIGNWFIIQLKFS